MSKKSRRRNKRILGALLLGGLGLAARNRRNKAIDTGIQSAEDDKGSDMMEFKEKIVTAPKVVTGTNYPGANRLKEYPRKKVTEKGYYVKDGVGQGFTGPGKFVTDDGIFVKGKKVSETAPKGILVRKDGTIKAGGKEYLNKQQYASRNEKPAMLSDSMFYEGTPQNSEFDQMVFDSVYAKGGRVKKKPFAKRGFGRDYKRRK